MFGFHQRSRSLIPIRDLEKMEKHLIIQEKQLVTSQDEQEEQALTPRQSRNMIMILLLFLAEAIMAASLSSQVALVLPAAACLSPNVSFLRSILECAYYFGSAMGLVWGWTTDRLGRRTVALVGLIGMSACCVVMGFATTFIQFAVLRCVAGALGSAVTVAGLAMLADSTHASSRRFQVVARIPLVVAAGNVAPYIEMYLHQLGEDSGLQVFTQYPGLGGQIACASFVAMITLAQMLLLDETLPQLTAPLPGQDIDSEKAGFLDARSSTDSLDITIIDALSITPAPSRISIPQVLAAPSVALLLAAASALALHSALFASLLPQLNQSLGASALPCTLLSTLAFALSALAALRVCFALPHIVASIGLLAMYKRIALALPLLYAALPLLTYLLQLTGLAAALPATTSLLTGTALLLQATLSAGAQVLILHLVLSAVPDAASTGSVVGVLSIANLCRAFAVGATGVLFALTEESACADAFVKVGMWAIVVGVAGVGAALAWRLRERAARVGMDIPEECLVWQDMFDSSSDDGEEV